MALLLRLGPQRHRSLWEWMTTFSMHLCLACTYPIVYENRHACMYIIYTCILSWKWSSWKWQTKDCNSMTVIMAHAIPWLQPRGDNLNQTTTKHMGFLSVACKCNRSNAKHDTYCQTSVFWRSNPNNSPAWQSRLDVEKPHISHVDHTGMQDTHRVV